MDSELFILAALFLWIAFFFAALSTSEMAFTISLAFFLFFANRTAISILDIMWVFTAFFLFEDLSALFAVLVTGIILSKTERYFFSLNPSVSLASLRVYSKIFKIAIKRE